MFGITIGYSFLVTVLLLVIAVSAILLMTKIIKFMTSTYKKDKFDYTLIIINSIIAIAALVWVIVGLVKIY